ncbi:MAG: hypothetical protein ACP5H2_01825 [Solirubrobacteraceae bacterium]
MSWIESASPSFACRHSSLHAADAARVLALLESTRSRLSEVLPQSDHEPTIVLHDSPHALALANPMLPLVWKMTARPARRYVAGWTKPGEVHVLSPSALRERASRVSGSFEMLALAPATLYVRRAIMDHNRDLRNAHGPVAIWRQISWAWLLEGASRWLSRESAYGRLVLGRFLLSGHRPHFPPSVREAPLVAASLFELLAEMEGKAGIARLISRLHSEGWRSALQGAFAGRDLGLIENEWRSRLMVLEQAS